jgi:hypothetical protein
MNNRFFVSIFSLLIIVSFGRDDIAAPFMHIVNPLLVLRTTRAHWDLVFQSAFETQTFCMMARDEVPGRHFSELRRFGFTAPIIRVVATGVEGTT